MEPQSVDKIAPGSLREFVTTASADERASVIVEAAGGPLVTELPKVGPSGRLTGQVSFAPEPVGHDQLIELLGQRLRGLTGRDPKPLKYAEAFVVADATPDQVREIASWPETATVRPNRVHRARA